MTRGLVIGAASAMLVACGGDSGSDGDSSSPDPTALQLLEQRITTGRSIISSNDWLCEFSNDDGIAQFTDTYQFLIDGLGTADDGFFNWMATQDDQVLVDKQVSDDTYTISNIMFSTNVFEDDGFTAVIDGQYFENAAIESFDISCTRTGPALF